MKAASTSIFSREGAFPLYPWLMPGLKNTGNSPPSRKRYGGQVSIASLDADVVDSATKPLALYVTLQ